MAKRPVKSETALLEKWRIALQNAQEQQEIAQQIAKYGFDAAKIEEGINLYSQTKQIWDAKQQEDLETLEASVNFQEKKDQLAQMYAAHRRRAKAKFKKQTIPLEKLQLSKQIPTRYAEWLEAVKKFYEEIAKPENETLKNDLLTYNTTQEELTQAGILVIEVEKLRGEYVREQAESQDATKLKNAALEKMADWMQAFYAMANDALIENPQLLEAVGIYRKS